MKSKWDLTAVSVSPCRSGMSVAANRLVMEQLCEDIQKAKQEHTARMLRIGRKRKDARWLRRKTEPYYRPFDKRKFDLNKGNYP